MSGVISTVMLSWWDCVFMRQQKVTYGTKKWVRREPRGGARWSILPESCCAAA
ncbi:hypothetical protein A3768_4150 (plasmid) [Ralstonia solanacearum]|nr:hypothetical protein A3768_4150 [Ralstonia solanacearum]